MADDKPPPTDENPENADNQDNSKRPYSFHLINATGQTIYYKLGASTETPDGKADTNFVLASFDKDDLKNFEPDIEKIYTLDEGHYMIFSSPYEKSKIRRLNDTDLVNVITSTEESKKVEVFVIVRDITVNDTGKENNRALN